MALTRKRVASTAKRTSREPASSLHQPISSAPIKALAI